MTKYTTLLLHLLISSIPALAADRGEIQDKKIITVKQTPALKSRVTSKHASDDKMVFSAPSTPNIHLIKRLPPIFEDTQWQAASLSKTSTSRVDQHSPARDLRKKLLGKTNTK